MQESLTSEWSRACWIVRKQEDWVFFHLCSEQNNDNGERIDLPFRGFKVKRWQREGRGSAFFFFFFTVFLTFTDQIFCMSSHLTLRGDSEETLLSAVLQLRIHGSGRLISFKITIERADWEVNPGKLDSTSPFSIQNSTTSHFYFLPIFAVRKNYLHMENKRGNDICKKNLMDECYSM